MKPVTPEELMAWEVLSNTMKKLKEEEATMRRDICLRLLEGKEAGVHKFVLDHCRVKAVRVLDYSLDQKEARRRYDAGLFTQDEEAMLNIKFGIYLGVYKKIGNGDFDVDLDKFNEMVTVKDAMPQLEVEFG